MKNIQTIRLPKVSLNGTDKNRKRAQSALVALRAFSENNHCSEEPIDTQVIDLVTNLLHLLRFAPKGTYSKESDLDVDRVLRISRDHYGVERSVAN